MESAKSLKKSMDFSDLSFGSGTSESVDLAQVEGNEAGSESEEDGEGGSPLNSPNKDLGASNYVGEIAERKLTVSELQARNSFFPTVFSFVIVDKFQLLWVLAEICKKNKDKFCRSSKISQGTN